MKWTLLNWFWKEKKNPLPAFLFLKIIGVVVHLGEKKGKKKRIEFLIC